MLENGRFDNTEIVTTDEEGKVHIFEKVDEIEVEGKRYALLIYQGSGEENEDGEYEAGEQEGYDEEVVVMKISHEDDAEVYEAIEDEEEFERVVRYIEEMSDEDESEEEAE